MAESKIFSSQFEALDKAEKGLLRVFGADPLKASKRKPRSLKFSNPNVASNPSQRQAVEKALSLEDSVLCIQGPPGTGKTSVIVEIIEQELRKNSSQRILIVSQSNLAVDNVLERLPVSLLKKSLRVGREERISEDLKRLSKDSRLPMLGLKDSLLRAFVRIPKTIISAPLFIFSRTYRMPKEKRLKENQLFEKYIRIIGATCIGSADQFLRYLLNKSKSPVDLVIIDEAGRSTIMESLVPMQFAKRALLVGDHKQLPPLVSSDVRKQWDAEFPNIECPGETSVLEAAVSCLPQSSVSFLNRQFRMHPQIGSFISEVFYAGQGLENGVVSEQRSWPIEGLPAAVSYHSTAKYGEKAKEKFHPDLKSYYNASEVQITMDLLETIDQIAKGREKPSVGIITFYTAQKELLKTKVKELDLENLYFSASENIATLDSFQGREEDIIILSLVRRPENIEKMDSKLYRFFLDIRRLNVALSRARKRLFIVGDLERISAVKSKTKDIPGMKVAYDLYRFVQELQSDREKLVNP